MTQTILERGALIPQPRENYKLLEERLLKSLELKVPRILKYGHFYKEEGKGEKVKKGEGFRIEGSGVGPGIGGKNSGFIRRMD